MNIIVLLLVGILVGWLASAVVGGGGGLLFDMIVGLLGALLAGFIFGGGASFIEGPLTLMSVLWSVVGAIILLLVLRLFRRGTYRRW
ncbi:MAG TPA: GlsB/YeaQ/YmgE family stress response membrane protein [Croceibacterium sp.]